MEINQIPVIYPMPHDPTIENCPINGDTQDDINIIHNLLESGTSINKAYGHADETILHFAATNNWLNVTKYLLDHNADVNAKGMDGATPLMWAAGYGNFDIVKCLLDNGANKECIRPRLPGYTAAMHASMCDNNDIAEYIESYEFMPSKGVHE